MKKYITYREGLVAEFNGEECGGVIEAMMYEGGDGVFFTLEFNPWDDGIEDTKKVYGCSYINAERLRDEETAVLATLVAGDIFTTFGAEAESEFRGIVPCDILSVDEGMKISKFLVSAIAEFKKM